MGSIRHAVLGIGFVSFALGSASAQAAASSRGVAFTVGLGATYGNLLGGDFSGSKAAAGFDANAGVVLHHLGRK